LTRHLQKIVASGIARIEMALQVRIEVQIKEIACTVWRSHYKFCVSFIDASLNPGLSARVIPCSLRIEHTRRRFKETMSRRCPIGAKPLCERGVAAYIRRRRRIPGHAAARLSNLLLATRLCRRDILLSKRDPPDILRPYALANRCIERHLSRPIGREWLS
jgi:hypothetical protein